MILDKELQFSSAQAVTATAVSTNVVDLNTAGIDIGTGENLFIHTKIDVAMTDAGSDSTITVELVTDDNSSMSTPVLVQTLGVFAAVSGITTKPIVQRIQPSALFERYIAIRYTATGGSLTTGSFSSSIVKDAELYKAYPKGFTVAP